MPSLEDISVKCLAVCQVPVDLSKDILISHVQKHLRKGKIIDLDQVIGIETNRSLTRVVLLCTSVEDVKHICQEVKQEEIQNGDDYIVVKYQKAIACELPERWERIQIPDADENENESSAGSSQPQPPPRHPEHSKPTGRDQQYQQQQFQYPVGPYGAMSGFYQNIPHSTAESMQRGGPMPSQAQGQAQGHAHGHAQGQPPMQGHEQRHRHPQGFSDQNIGQGQHQNFPFGPGQFPLGPNMFGRPPFPYDPQNAKGGQRMPFPPGMPMPMPMYIDPKTGQLVYQYPPQFANVPPEQAGQGGVPMEHHQQHPRGPPPPYNHWNVKGQGPLGQSPAIADQAEMIQKLQAKADTEKQTLQAEKEEDPRPEADVEEPVRSDEEPETEEKPTKIVVSNLPSTAHEEYLEMFFENKRKYGGGPVFNVEFDEESNTAVVEFEEPESVDIVLEKLPLKMMGKKVDVEVYLPAPPIPLCTIEVTGPCSIVCEEQLETLEMYFENTKRSGGDTIVDCLYDDENNMVLVTFETEEVAQRVEERESHKVKREILRVTLHNPGKKTERRNKTEEKEEEEKKEEEPEAPKTIKVKGVDKSASRDTVEYYFENTKRSGGGEIEKIYSDEEDEEVLYITFVNEDDAENVVKRESHHVDGKELSVSLYVPPEPPPCYDDKIIIKGLKSSTTQVGLFNFIEAKTGFIPETMDYHSELEDVVMVSFSDNPDLQKLETVFGRSKLEGASLKISPVPISNCIIVANLASEVTTDTVEYYFENTRKSGGGAVEKVVMNEDDTCLVYFEDYTIIDRILEKTHRLIGQDLEVIRFQECLGKPEREIGERKLVLPDDVVLDVDPQITKFLEHSAVNCSALEKQLDVCYAKINWPAEGEQVVLTCTLTKEVKDCFKLVKKWKETAKQNFRDFMKLIFVKKVPVLQDIWVKVMEELQKVNIDNPEAVAIFVDNKEKAITVVGNKHVAETLSKKIDDITKSVMEEAEKEREKIKEVFTALKPIETRMLLADKFPTEMEQTFTDLKVKINQNKNEIVFEGPLGQVRDAKLKMYEMKSKFAQARANKKIPELSAGMFGLKQVKEYIVKKLKASKLTAVWDVISGSLIVYSTSEERIQECLGIIRESVIENTIALKKASKTVVNSEGWQSKIDELHAYKTGKCNIKVSDDSARVHVCATEDVANEIVDSVKKFLRLNTVVEVKVPCTQTVHRLIERHHKQELQNIAKSLQDMYVQISSVPGYGFEVRGTEDGIQKARDKLSQLLERVQKREHVVSKPGLAKHMQTPKGKDNLNTIESNLECVVAVKGDDYAEESEYNPYDTIPVDSGVSENVQAEGVKILGYCKAYDCRNIYTVEGDMTELKVDMLVNSADEKLSLTGGLEKAVVRKGGMQIQKECAAYIRSEGRLEGGDAFVSTGGNLKASCIAHVLGPVWKGGMQKEDELLEEAVFKCLQQASTRSLVSVAIPAIGCRTYGYPVKKATSKIVEAVKDFFREVQDSTVTDVYLIDMKLNIVEAFNECLKKEFGASNFRKYDIKEKRRPHSTASDDELYEEDIRPMGRKGPPSPKGRPTRSLDGASTNIGHIAVSVVKGEIAKQKVDVIVNTTVTNLDLKNGAVSASLLRASGMQLQQEVSQKYPNGIKDGEIAVTTGQNLKCDVVIHSSMINWDGKNDGMCKGALHNLMKDCLNEAEKQNKTSIAFPAIGTGNLGFPKDAVASEMFSAVSQFAENNSQSSVKDVRFIVYQKDFSTIKAFEDETKRWATGKRGGRLTRKFDVYEGLQLGRGTGKAMLPREILNMDSQAIKLYCKALSEGKDDVRNIRLMIVGHFGAGKTTLAKRLFRKNVNIMERKSTDGIDVHVGRCKVSLETKTWSNTDGQKKTLDDRLATLIHNTNKEKGQLPVFSKYDDSKSDGPVKSVSSKIKSSRDTKRSKTFQSVSSNINERPRPDVHPTLAPNLSASESSPKNTLKEENDSQKDDFLRQKNHLEEFVKAHNEGFTNNERCCDLSLWDFAGQSIFYATHQAFLSRRAIYLIVFDISKHITDIVEDDIWRYDCKGEHKCKISEFIEFWLNSIHEFCSCLEEHGPPVILIGTFVDKLKKGSDDAENAFKTLKRFFLEKVASCHLQAAHFYVDNSLDEDENVEKLRQYIVKVASEQKHWGESIPARWITLERSLIDLEEEHSVKVISMEKLKEIDRQLPVPIKKQEELDLFLKFHHETGTILYFGDEDMKNDILLKPQWLIDAFKSLITAPMFIIEKENISQKWVKFDRSAILKSDLISLIWQEEENKSYLAHKDLILRFMEKLGFFAKPKKCMSRQTQADDFYLVPCMLKDPPPAKIISCKDLQYSKSTSKLCFTNDTEPEQRFIPTTAFNKLIAACVNQWPLAMENGKYMIFCGGAEFRLKDNHFLYIFLYEHVIQIWISRKSKAGHNPNTQLCRDVKDEIQAILKKNVRMQREILPFVKCQRYTLYSNENMVLLQEDVLEEDSEITCYCQQPDEHVVSFMDLGNWWLPEDRVQAPHLDLEKKPTEKDFSRISLRIGKEYKQLAFQLGLSQADLDHIEMDHNFTTADKITAVLNMWAKRMHDNATFRNLVKAMADIGIDIASVFKE